MPPLTRCLIAAALACAPPTSASNETEGSLYFDRGNVALTLRSPHKSYWIERCDR